MSRRNLLDRLRSDPDRPSLVDRALKAVLPRLPAWLLPALAAAAVIGVLLVAWSAVS